MNKEEILEKSRKENKNKDMAEIEAIKRASRIAAITGAVLCMVISVLDWNITKTINWACWTVDFGMMSVLNAWQYFKLRYKKNLVLATISILLLALFGYGYIFELMSAVR
ncbi:MAG: DUF6442 family protein [Oscillospiraceae bacterium]|nr:DUF6442 family protein [Oscillospiraceae bacterium]